MKQLRLTVLSTVCAAVLLSGVGCQTTGQTAQNGALVRARAAIEQRDYEFALQRLEAAETYHQPTADIKAEILYLKGFCLESLQRPVEAVATYREAAENYPSTAFGVKARQKLE